MILNISLRICIRWRRWWWSLWLHNLLLRNWMYHSNLKKIKSLYVCDVKIWTASKTLIIFFSKLGYCDHDQKWSNFQLCWLLSKPVVTLVVNEEYKQFFPTSKLTLLLFTFTYVSVIESSSLEIMKMSRTSRFITWNSNNKFEKNI